LGYKREQITVQSSKTMVTIVWNSTGFYQIVALPKGMKFNAEYHSAHLLDTLAEWRRSQVGDSDRRSHVHADHARPQIGEKGPEFLAGNGRKRTPRPSYSPDLAPCDFSLLGISKTGSQVHYLRNPINFCRRLI
jgi:hypothetical protein